MRRHCSAWMTWRHLLCWYGAVVIIGAFGSYAAYELPGSAAWRIWSGGHFPWAVDAVRLLVCGVFALFTIWNLELLEPENRELAATVFDGWRLGIPLLVPAVAVAITVGFAPMRFIAGLPSRGYTGGYGFYDIYLPYFPFAVYTSALWGGIGMPVLTMLIARFSSDRKLLRQNRRALEAEFRALETVSLTEPLIDFQRSQVALQNYLIRLKQIAERYIPVLLTVSTVLIYEQFTPSWRTVTAEAQDLGKFALWLLLVPSLLVCLTVVTFGYQAVLRRAEATYAGILNRLAERHQEAREKILAYRDHLLWERSSGSFILSILKSTTVFVLLVSSVTFYVMSNLDAKTRLALFIPKVILSLIQKIFS
jgi:hypothetical protein